MATQSRLTASITTLLCAALLLITGCGQSSAAFGSGIDVVQDSSVARSIQYVDGRTEGPLYSFALNVPDEWMDQFVTRSAGNVVYFDYIGETEQPAPIFRIEALSESQFWEQQGSYPGQQFTVLSTAETYFIYYLPIDAFYSGLNKLKFEELAGQVPEVMSTFEIVE